MMSAMSSAIVPTRCGAGAAVVGAAPCAGGDAGGAGAGPPEDEGTGGCANADTVSSRTPKNRMFVSVSDAVIIAEPAPLRCLAGKPAAILFHALIWIFVPPVVIERAPGIMAPFSNRSRKGSR